MIKRIVSLAPSVSETIYALGHQDLLVGVTDHCNYPEHCNTLPKIGGFANPNIDTILALKPDCIITTTFHKKEKLAVFTDQGIQVEQIAANKITDSANTIRHIGQIINQEANANKLANKIETQLNDLFESAKLKKHKPKVCYLCTSVPFCSHKQKCQTNHLVKQLGAHLIAYTKENIVDDIIQANPDIIIIPYTPGSNDYNSQMAFINEHPELQKTTSFKNNKVVSINGELLSRPGPRSAEGLQTLFNLIYS